MMTDYSEPADNPKERGQSLVEFALVLMFVILPFIFVISDGAMTVYTYVMVTNAAREGARGGSIYQYPITTTGTLDFGQQVALIDTARATYAQQETQRLLGNLISYPQCTTVITYTPAVPVVNSVYNPYRELDTMRLTLACPRRMFFGLIGTQQITLSATASMRIEPGGVAPSSQ